MHFKDYYATLGVAPTATRDEIKRAYRQRARQFHPDVSQEPDAEARFKEVAEAHAALIDPERRAAYDDIAQRRAAGGPFEPPQGRDAGFEFSGRGSPGGPDPASFSDFFESIFGRGGLDSGPASGRDHHAQVSIELDDACRGARRTISLRRPVVDAQGQARLQAHQIEVSVPKGVRDGQHLRLAGQGAPGQGGAPAGDLYLEIRILPHPVFRLDGGDLYFDLPVAPWEAALGASVAVPTLDGTLQLSIPPGSSPGRRLRLKGRGLPGTPPGDLYAVLSIALPEAATATQQQAYQAFAQAFAAFDPRAQPPR